MIELLILHALYKQTLTMYGVSKEIKLLFSTLTTPSYGTIKPALKRLEAGGFVKLQKSVSEGGRVSVYYSITKDGAEELKRLLLSPPQENPVQFMTAGRIKLACAGILDNREQAVMLRQLKDKAQSIMLDTKNILENKNLTYYPKMVFDNLICEYKNFISLLEGFENACNG